MRPRATRRAALAGLMAAAACAPRAPRPITIFAAASLEEALAELAEMFEVRTGRAVRASFGASGLVARQILAGAPADLVMLADAVWMDRLETAGALRRGSRANVVGNRLVLIASPTARVEGPPLDWLVRTRGRLVIGDPESVPAGAYARAWLRRQGLWERLEPAVAAAADVRAVRAFVARGDAQLGIVYGSDVVGAAEVAVVLEPDPHQHPPIVYPAALTRNGANAAGDVLDWLRSPEAATVFARRGFIPLAPG